MPTTDEEARTIVRTMLEHLEPHAAAAVAHKLWDRVGQHTANSSVRETMLMLRDGVDRVVGPPPCPPLVQTLIGVIVAAHWLMILGNAFSGVVLVGAMLYSVAPPTWAIALPLLTFLVWHSSSRVADCPLTTIEDRVRRSYGQPPIKAFLSFYAIRHIRCWLAARHGRSA
jgi:hypothetical protein